MLAKIIRKFADFLERLDRKDIRVIRTGQVIFERYYFLPWTGRGSSFKYPNVVLHHMIEPDGEFNWHDHGRNCISIILTGGYDDQRVDKDGKKYVLKRRAPSISFFHYDTLHTVSNVLPDTWTIFLVGREKKDVLFAGDLVSGQRSIRKDAEALDGTQLTGLRQVTPELLARIKRRQAAVTKLLSNKVTWKNKNEMVD
jgi:hypothetical protein